MTTNHYEIHDCEFEEQEEIRAELNKEREANND
jgi:hypothetical protein